MSDPLYIDELQLYVGRDFQVNDYIKIHIPRVGEIVDYGEKEYYQMIYSCLALQVFYQHQFQFRYFVHDNHLQMLN